MLSCHRHIMNTICSHSIIKKVMVELEKYLKKDIIEVFKSL